jgi:uncharacterized protein GlcG (DUF336 family)
MMATKLTLDHAQKIIAASFDKGREIGLKPLSTIVLDAGGHVIAFQRQDGASIMRFDIASGKAAAALALGVSSRTVATMAAERPSFIAGLIGLAHGRFLPAAGGVLIAGEDGLPLGAVGVTGDTSDNDEICALEGVRAAGLAVLAK